MCILPPKIALCAPESTRAAIESDTIFMPVKRSGFSVSLALIYDGAWLKNLPCVKKRAVKMMQFWMLTRSLALFVSTVAYLALAYSCRCSGDECWKPQHGEARNHVHEHVERHDLANQGRLRSRTPSTPIRQPSATPRSRGATPKTAGATVLILRPAILRRFRIVDGRQHVFSSLPARSLKIAGAALNPPRDNFGLMSALRI